MRNLKFVAPVAMFVFAITSAFGTHSAAKTITPATGWERHGLRVCTNSMQCKLEEDVICTSPSTSQQIFAKDASGDCVVKLYRLN